MELVEKIASTAKYSETHFREVQFPNNIPHSPNPLALSKWYAKELDFLTAQFEAIDEKCGLNCTCSAGCDSCCSQLIVLSEPELLSMTPYVLKLSLVEKDELMAKVNSLCAILSENGFSIYSPSNTFSYDAQQELQSKYFSLHLKCPLLSSDGKCSVYRTRPLLCVAYRCYGDPDICHECFNPDETINYDGATALVLKRLTVAKKPRKQLALLPFALAELLNKT